MLNEVRKMFGCLKCKYENSAAQDNYVVVGLTMAIIGISGSCAPLLALCTTLHLVHHGSQGTDSGVVLPCVSIYVCVCVCFCLCLTPL